MARLPKPVDEAALPHPEKLLVASGQWLEKIRFVFPPHKCSSVFVLLATNHWPLTTAAMGPEGLEPSPRWLRARHAAANTWIPKIGPEGVEPSSGLIRGRLWPLSYGPETNDE